MKQSVYLTLGSNLNQERCYPLAVKKIAALGEIAAVSPIYETEPVDYEAQGWFLNMVIRGTTALTPEELLLRLQQTERELGRIRSIDKGPRTIDLDILFFSGKILALDDLTIPHPEIQNRGFVLAPMAESAPGFVHPKLGKSVESLLENLKHEKQVKKWTKKESPI